ncbi:hypothetical protein ACWEKT_04720 [Nocardia takedensis]|uniref:hypothetical protein n=1 Tax=Nocardia takedensis TaxID=259390 RepID=UPI000593F552|nr:hypothetical protein [Nocardia takedensis]
MGNTMYLDLLATATTFDHTVWASPDLVGSDTWNTAMELAAKKKKKGGGGLIFGLICCVLVVVAIIVAIVLFTKRKKNN